MYWVGALEAPDPFNVVRLDSADAGVSPVALVPSRTWHLPPRAQDDDLLSVYKIQSTHTIHMVKGAAKSSASSGPSASCTAFFTAIEMLLTSLRSPASASSQPLPANLQTGQNVHDPLTQLNSHLTFGNPAFANFNPFADMGVRLYSSRPIMPGSPTLG